jgi:hypothetical protein
VSGKFFAWAKGKFGNLYAMPTHYELVKSGVAVSVVLVKER